MEKNFARKLVKDALQHSFEKERFTYLVRNLLNRIDETKAFHARGYVKDKYKKSTEIIKTYERIGTYTDPQGNKTDVLIVYLQKENSIERARTTLRNFVADYLKNRGEKNASLVAFVPPNPEDWRFSFVKMDYKFVETPKGYRAQQEFTPARRYSFLVGENENSHTAQSRLVPILIRDEHNPTIKEIEDAFSIEKVTKEFFEKYRELFIVLKEALDEIVKKDQKIKSDFAEKKVNTIDFAKKLLGQIVFLYFLQKKGWFGVAKDADWGTGPKHFLRRLFEKKHADYSNFFNDILEPLFYNTLAIERTFDYSDRFNCKIPFLNGGLFDPINNYDWVHTDILLPNELFSNKANDDEGTGILDVFDIYNFTVKEDEPLEKEVAVDPEMLGKVFENLLEVKDRKSKGTYYTPREIVHYMCQQSLINYLDATVNTAPKHIVPEKVTQGKFFGPKEAQQKSLTTDGYETIVPRQDLEFFIQHGQSALEHDKRVEAKGRETKRYPFLMRPSVRENVEVIDKALESIRICDPAIGSGAFPVGMMHEIVNARDVLSTYLNGSENRTPYGFKRHAIQSCLYGVDIDPGAVEIAKLRLWLSLIVDEDDIKQIKPLPNLDYKIIRGNSLLGVQRSLENWKDFAELEKIKPLFFNETSARKKQKIKAQIDEIISRLTNGQTDFDFEIFFSEVFHEKKGFDVVIGNPPYDEISNKEEKKFFQKYYSAVLSGHYDLYIFFFKKAFSIARKTGIISFITPHTYLHYTQFKNLRKWIYENSHIIEITSRISGVFESAVVDNAMILLKTNHSESEEASYFMVKHITNGTLFDDEVLCLNHSQFDSDSFDIDAIKNREILTRFSADTVPLGSITKSTQGITVYAKVQGKKVDWFRKKRGNEDSKPVVRGRHLTKYCLRWNGEYIQYGSWLWCPRKPKFFESEKLFFRQTADSIVGTYAKDPIYCIDSVHSFINPQNTKEYDLRYILAILNSRFGNYLYRLLITETGKVFAQVKLIFLRKLPIKVSTKDRQQVFVDAVNKILSITTNKDYPDNSTKQDKVEELEKQIDQMVYKLYDLTPEEIDIVEGRNKAN